MIKSEPQKDEFPSASTSTPTSSSSHHLPPPSSSSYTDVPDEFRTDYGSPDEFRQHHPAGNSSSFDTSFSDTSYGYETATTLIVEGSVLQIFCPFNFDFWEDGVSV